MKRLGQHEAPAMWGSNKAPLTHRNPVCLSHWIAVSRGSVGKARHTLWQQTVSGSPVRRRINLGMAEVSGQPWRKRAPHQPLNMGVAALKRQGGGQQ